MIDDATNVSRLLHERVDALRFQPLDPDNVIRRGRATRLRRRLAGGSILVAAAVAAIVVATVGRGFGEAERPARIVPVTQTPTPAATISPTSSPPTPSYSPPAIPAGWVALPTAPAGSGVGFGGAARVGTSIAYWGGDGPDGYKNHGAVLELSSRTWSAMSTSPLEGRSAAALAGSDQLLFVWGGGRLGTKVYGGATYNVVTREWRKVSQAPLSARVPLGSVWTGSEFLVVGESTTTQQKDPVADGAAYNPATDSWRSIASLPTALTSATVLHASGQTVVLGTDAKPNAFGSNFMFVLADGASAWRTYAPPANAESATLTATTDGTTIFAAAGPQYLNVPRADASINHEATIVMQLSFGSGVWRDLGNPFFPINCYPRLAATQKGVWEFGCVSARYDRATQTWRQLDLPGGTPIVVGSEIVISGYAIGVDS